MDKTECEVCGRSDVKLCWDHDHTTGYVQGVLCDRCNSAKGFLQEDLRLVERMADYLRRPPTTILYDDLCRQRDAEWMREHRKRNPMTEEQRESGRQRTRERYANDPEYREKVKARAAKWNRDHGYIHQRAQTRRKGTLP